MIKVTRTSPAHQSVEAAIEGESRKITFAVDFESDQPVKARWQARPLWPYFKGSWADITFAQQTDSQSFVEILVPAYVGPREIGGYPLPGLSYPIPPGVEFRCQLSDGNSVAEIHTFTYTTLAPGNQPSVSAFAIQP